MEEGNADEAKEQLVTTTEENESKDSNPVASPLLNGNKKFSRKDSTKSIDNEAFDAIQRALKGTKVIEVPRVSRETIISVLQTHTELIKSLRKDHITLNTRVTAVHEETKENDRQLKVLTESNEKNKQDIETLYKMSNNFRREMEEISEKVTELYVLKKQIEDQKLFLDTLSGNFQKFSTEVNTFMNSTNTVMSTLQTNMSETQFMVREVKEYVEHFGDNIVLSSSQIMVDSSIGFSAKPINLSETLKLCNGQFGDLESKTRDHDRNIEKITEDLDNKAPDSCMVNIDTLEKKVRTIEIHLQKEEEQGIGAIRKTTEELSVAVQTMTVEMMEKIDRENVNIIVHEKYEEIVQYLQDALQSSLEDENSFKKKADEIYDLVTVLQNSKADRAEINNMQELMVKSESMLKKVGSQMNIKDRLKEFISKKDLEALLLNKIDRTEFEFQLQNLQANSRKSKKLAPISSQYPPPVEDAINSSFDTGFERNGRVDRPGHLEPFDESYKQRAISPPVNIPVITMGKGLLPSSNIKNIAASKSLPPNVAPGAFRMASEGAGNFTDEFGGPEYSVNRAGMNNNNPTYNTNNNGGVNQNNAMYQQQLQQQYGSGGQNRPEALNSSAYRLYPNQGQGGGYSNGGNPNGPEGANVYSNQGGSNYYTGTEMNPSGNPSDPNDPGYQGGNKYNPNQPGGNNYNPNQPGGNNYNPNQPGGNNYNSNQPGGNNYNPNQPGGNNYNSNQPGGNNYNPNQLGGGGYYNPNQPGGGYTGNGNPNDPQNQGRWQVQNPNSSNYGDGNNNGNPNNPNMINIPNHKGLMGSTDEYKLTEYPIVPNGPLPNSSNYHISTEDSQSRPKGKAGGGFSGPGQLKKNAPMPSGKAVSDIDIEGQGLMLKGKDGNFYYPDPNEISNK